MAETKWQSIESAPKDGSRVLLIVKGQVHIGFFGPKYSRYGVNYGDAWGHGVRWDEAFDPTYWMPLPDPPSGGE